MFSVVWEVCEREEHLLTSTLSLPSLKRLGPSKACNFLKDLLYEARKETIDEDKLIEYTDTLGVFRTRPRKTSLREDRLFLSNGKLNSSQILKQWTVTSNVSVCQRTIRGRLLEIGLRGCKVRPKPLLTEFQRKRRLTWAKEHSLWTIKDWEKVGEKSQYCISDNQSRVPM
ncbi:hypothetical protein TNCV_4834221 [Trichonephila clavipes]|nr:hypothetical protein TNCV_4834221 [Trichonephila clavipes]